MGSSLTKDGVDASTRTADASPEQSSATKTAPHRGRVVKKLGTTTTTTATSARGLCPRACSAWPRPMIS